MRRSWGGMGLESPSTKMRIMVERGGEGEEEEEGKGKGMRRRNGLCARWRGCIAIWHGRSRRLRGIWSGWDGLDLDVVGG